MELKAKNTMTREMNNGRTKNYEQTGIHGHGTHDGNRDQELGLTMQPQVKQTDQTSVSGYFPLLIPEQDPIKGEIW